MSRAELRRQLGIAAVLSPTEAASWLPWRDSDSLAWLRSEGLVANGPLGEFVLWASVLERLGNLSSPPPSLKPKQPKLQRASLE